MAHDDVWGSISIPIAIPISILRMKNKGHLENFIIDSPLPEMSKMGTAVFITSPLSFFLKLVFFIIFLS